MAWSETRRGGVAVTVLWLLGVGLVAASGNSHGLVDSGVDRASLPYEWHGVVFESAVLGAEALALFWLLFKTRRLTALSRTLAAFVLFAALVTFCILTTITDMPGWYYINTAWTMLVLLMLAARLAVQLGAAALARTRTPRA